MGFEKSRLQEKYDKDIRPLLMTQLGLKNINLVPRVGKIVLNIGVGEARDNPKAMENAIQTLEIISGQKAMVTLAKKSVSNFKVRAGMKNGCMVTLRGHVMWHFLDKLMNVVLPRVRDFQGVSVKNLDSQGNFNLGLKDQLVFPEIIFDEIGSLKGLQITVVTTAKNHVEGAHLFSYLGMPFNDYDTVAKVA